MKLFCLSVWLPVPAHLTVCMPAQALMLHKVKGACVMQKQELSPLKGLSALLRVLR